jgi:hypothetical protein
LDPRFPSSPSASYAGKWCRANTTRRTDRAESRNRNALPRNAARITAARVAHRASCDTNRGSIEPARAFDRRSPRSATTSWAGPIGAVRPGASGWNKGAAPAEIAKLNSANKELQGLVNSIDDPVMTANASVLIKQLDSRLELAISIKDKAIAFLADIDNYSKIESIRKWLSQN